MKREAIEGFLDLGLRDGRIGADMRETWVRLFEANSESAFELFVARPHDKQQAQRNFWSLDDNEKKFRREMACILKCRPEEVL
jgi:hypothetical protein